jgi:hypothetical protein
MTYHFLRFFINLFKNNLYSVSKSDLKSCRNVTFDQWNWLQLFDIFNDDISTNFSTNVVIFFICSQLPRRYSLHPSQFLILVHPIPL